MINLLDKFEKLELDNQKIIFIAIVSLALFYVDIAFIMGGQIKTIKSASSEIIKLKKEIDLANQNLAKAKNNQANLNMNLKARKLMTEEELAGLFQDIYSMASKNKIKIEQINPVKEADPRLDKNSGLYAMLIVLELDADYHRMGSFINDLENSDFLIEVKHLIVMPNGLNILLQKVNLTIKTYVSK